MRGRQQLELDVAGPERERVGGDRPRVDARRAVARERNAEPVRIAAHLARLPQRMARRLPEHLHRVERQLGQRADEAARRELVVGLAPADQVARLLVGVVRDAHERAPGRAAVAVRAAPGVLRRRLGAGVLVIHRASLCVAEAETVRPITQFPCRSVPSPKSPVSMRRCAAFEQPARDECSAMAQSAAPSARRAPRRRPDAPRRGVLARFWRNERRRARRAAHHRYRHARSNDESRGHATSEHRIPVPQAVREFHRRRMGRPGRRRVFRQRLARHRPAVHRDPSLARSRHRARARRRSRGQGGLGREGRGRARERAAEDRRPDGGEPHAPRRRRDDRQRQAAARNHRGRRAARDRPLPLLRGLHPRAGRLDRRYRRRHGGLPLPRAARRRRPDHPVELPAADGRVEARAGARGRQLRRAQAGRADARVDPRVRRADPGSAAARRAQHRQRLRPRGRQAARVEQADREDRVHGRDVDGPPHHAVREREPDSRHARAGRQEPEYFLRRRDGSRRQLLRQGARRLRDVRAEPGRSLHVPIARARRGEHLRSLHRTRAQARRGDQAGPSARFADDDRRAGVGRAAREDPVVHRHRPRRRRAMPDGRRAQRARRRARRRLLREADRVPRPQQDAHLPGRNLRAGARGDDVQDRGGSARDRERHAVRPGRRRLDARRQPRVPLRPRHPGGPRVDELLSRVSGARGVRRLQAIRHRPRDAQDDARPLPADEEPARQLQRKAARVLLIARGAGRLRAA
ncbi:hypothetical protein BURPS1710b_0136 [Burkholderia pseudomallei 1710b]|uniref:Uncharacterized protein n=1 Tax=Burkholderia pseudomallei (strain 1710b) TaxID=320372 RepID=Q3JY01_BURP1|nr:hypothetical protein BURPS1710b_0136 [Burkholderia pseudomallei 1710b]